jgi:hypothetical protein
MLAGLRAPDDEVRELWRLVDEPTRGVLQKASAFLLSSWRWWSRPRATTLTLDDARTDALAELRAVLLNEHEGRARDGLVWSARWPRFQPCERGDHQGMPAKAFVIRFPNGDYEYELSRRTAPGIGETVRRNGELWKVVRITQSGAITQDAIDTVHVERVKDAK